MASQYGSRDQARARASQPVQRSLLNRIWTFAKKRKAALIPTAVGGAMLSWLVTFATSNVTVQFSKPLNPGYEFTLENAVSVPMRIESFRVHPFGGKDVVFVTTRAVTTDDLPANRAPGIALPSGTAMRLPLFEYKGLDGAILRAKASVNVRLPPVSDRDWLELNYGLVQIDYTVLPEFRPLRAFSNVLAALHLRHNSASLRYLVVKGYWTPVPDGIDDVMAQACAEDAAIRASSLCGDMAIRRPDR